MGLLKQVKIVLPKKFKNHSNNKPTKQKATTKHHLLGNYLESYISYVINVLIESGYSVELVLSMIACLPSCSGVCLDRRMTHTYTNTW